MEPRLWLIGIAVVIVGVAIFWRNVWRSKVQPLWWIGIGGVIVVGIAVSSGNLGVSKNVQPNPIFLQGPNSVDRWSCTKYAVHVALSPPPAKVDLSTTPTAFGKFYSTDDCAQNTDVSTVDIDPSTQKADFYFWSPFTGTAQIRAVAQGSGQQVPKNVTVSLPQEVPGCPKVSGTCHCPAPPLYKGVRYIRIPYDVKGAWATGCCPHPDNTYYQLYEQPVLYCKKS